MTNEAVLRHQLSETPANVLRRLPLMGRVMVVAKDAAATHERIGEIERLEKAGDLMFLISAEHDCEIDVSALASAIVDRSGRMKDKVLPKIEFTNAVGETVFSVIALDGIAKFDYAVAQFKGMPLSAAGKPASEPATLGTNDVGAVPLHAAHKAEAEITIEMNLAGLKQSWTGLVPEINPAMGFINMMTKDFHLHLRGGAVSKWQRSAAASGDHIELVALDGAGKLTGLVLRGPSSAFGAAA